MSVLMLLALVLVAGGAASAQANNTTAGVGSQLRIAAWNLQRFGLTKIGKSKVVDVIVKVMRRYDIILIQEVVDSTETAVYTLLQELNNGTTEPYNLTISERLGRSSYKEQYCFYWKSSRVSLNGTYQYHDSRDTFQIEPFTIIFNTNLTGLPRFAIMAIHAKPDDAHKEIDALVDVYDVLKKNKSIEDVFIMGDMNAGCTYVTSNEWNSIRLHTNPLYTWLISDHADTTTKSTSCPYDRIVMRGEALSNNTYKNSARPFYYDEELGITDNELIEDVSDHYPVEVALRGSVPPELKNKTKVRVGVEVSTAVVWENVESMVRALSNCKATQEVHRTRNGIVVVHWLAKSLKDTQTSLTSFSATYPDVLTPQALSVLLYKLKNQVLTDTSLYGASLEDSKNIQMTLLCLYERKECTTSVASLTTIN